MYTEDATNRFLVEKPWDQLDLVQLAMVYRMYESAIRDLDTRRQSHPMYDEARDLRDELFTESLMVHATLIYRASQYSPTTEFVRSTGQIMGTSPRIARIISGTDLQPCSYRSSQQGLSCWELLTYIANSRERS